MGVRAAGGVPIGADIEPQPCFERMFGEGSFSVADATDRADFLQRVRRVKPMVMKTRLPQEMSRFLPNRIQKPNQMQIPAKVLKTIKEWKRL